MSDKYLKKTITKEKYVRSDINRNLVVSTNMIKNLNEFIKKIEYNKYYCKF